MRSSRRGHQGARFAGSPTPARGEHLVHPGELDAWAPRLPATSALDGVEPQPVLVRQTARLSIVHQALDRERRRLGRMEDRASGQILYHARHRLRRVGLVMSDNVRWTFVEHYLVVF